MAAATVTSFKGIAPGLVSASSFAEVAQNVDLSAGGLRPFKAHRFVEAGHSGEIVYWGGQWLSGGENYISTVVEGAPALIYKQNGAWKMRIGTQVADLYTALPSAPTLVDASLPTPTIRSGQFTFGSGLIEPGTYAWYLRFVMLDGDTIVTTSRFSAATAQTFADDAPGQATILYPMTNDLRATHWEIWRGNPDTGYAMFVERLSITENTYLDNKTLDQLGEIASVVDAEATYDLSYLLSTVREIGGLEFESAPSELATISVKQLAVKISRPVLPIDAIRWKLYRLSSGLEATGEFQLVTDQLAAVESVYDYAASFTLGEAMPSRYVAEDGSPVVAGIPDAPFEGMFGPISGFYLGWIGSDLYVSDYSNPTWWPGAYVKKSKDPIVGVSANGDAAFVVTTDGIQIGRGSTPAAFFLSLYTKGEAGIGRRAMRNDLYVTRHGIFQMSADSDVQLITPGFSPEQFSAIVTGYEDDITLEYYKGCWFMFHPNGALVYDDRVQQFITLDIQSAFGAIHKEAGILYGRVGGYIQEVFGGDEFQNMQYKSGKLTFDEPHIKWFDYAEFWGAGDMFCRLYADGRAQVGRTVDLDTNYVKSRQMGFRHGQSAARASQFEIIGAGTVTEVRFELLPTR